MKPVRILVRLALCCVLASCAPEEGAKAPAPPPEKKEQPKAEALSAPDQTGGQAGANDEPSTKDAAKPQPEKPEAPHRRGVAVAEVTRPAHFPHRIWAACDFEARTLNYGWFGSEEKENIPKYPGNLTALSGRSHKHFAWYAGINPVPGPRMDVVNHVYFRYHLKGTDKAQVQHFNLSKNDNHHIRVSGLTESAWSELTLNFTRDSKRNDGSPGAMVLGDRMDDLKVFLGRKGDGKEYGLLLDDIIFFSERPGMEPDAEPFPNRVIFLAAFDTGEKEKYWPGEFEIVSGKDAPPGSYWRVAKAVPTADGKGRHIRLEIKPPRPVGKRTAVRCRWYLKNAAGMAVRLHERTADRVAEHVLSYGPEGSWRASHFKFNADPQTGLLAVGNQVDRVEFIARPASQVADLELYIDEVVLYDAGEPVKR